MIFNDLECIDVYVIILDERIISGFNQCAFITKGRAKSSMNLLLENYSKSNGFKSGKELREYLEKEGRLKYKKIEI